MRGRLRDALSAVLVIALIAAVCAGIVSITSKSDKTVSPGVFSRGALDGSGKYVETDSCLYTEELIQCQGLTIEVDFEASLEYEVYYFRADESFIGSTGRLSDDYVKEGFKNAKYCRIVIIPELKDGADKIRFWEVLSYAKQITVKVSKDQSFADLEGLTVSFLGDGLTTYEGYIPDDEYAYYNSDIMSVDDTWWKQTVDQLGLELRVNNSYHGSGIGVYTGGVNCGYNRYLDIIESAPSSDIFILMIGAEDIRWPDYLHYPDSSEPTMISSYFDSALDKMLSGLSDAYGVSNVFICTILPSDINTDDNLAAFNDVILQKASLYGVNVIDLCADSGITRANYSKYTLDGVYLNKEGMDLVTRTVTDCLIENYG